MEQTPYQRVNLHRLDREQRLLAARARHELQPRLSVRGFILPLSIALSIAQSFVWLLASNLKGTPLAGTLVPTIGFAALMLFVLAINPTLRFLTVRRVRFAPRPLGRVELMTLFCALLLTSGLSTFGLVEQLVPLIPSPYNADWNTPQRGWDTGVLPHLNNRLYITDPEVIHDFRWGFGPGPSEGSPWTAHAAFYWSVFRKIPWGEWIRPLTFWMVFILACYGLFYSLTFLVIRAWSREQLIFPLTRLPEILLPDSDRKAGVVPQIFHPVGFWAGFAVSMGVLSWNGVANAGWIGPGVAPIPLGMSAWHYAWLVQNTFLGTTGGAISFLIIFTTIGLAFLLPLEMSFSVWFYYLVGQGIIQLLIHLGYGGSPASFPADFLSTSNPVSAQGGGGLFAFSAVTLAKCLWEYRRLAYRKSWPKKLVIAMPVVGFAASSVVMILWLMWNHLPPLWAFVFVLVTSLLTVGVMRIVAQSGIYWFQTHTGFFHLYRIFGIGHYLLAPVIAPILPIYSVLFMDIKCLLAPNILTAAKLHDDVGGRRSNFHLTMVTSVISSIVASCFFSIYLAYIRGANRMHWWFYGQAPRLIFDSARDLANTQQAKLSPSLAGWSVAGAAWVVFSLFIRRTVFWFPHPIGYIMLINPLMDQLWFSFLIAWLIKRPVMRYGGKMTYEKARVIVIGLIVGELVAIAVWSLIAVLGGVWVGEISLNRYGA